MKPLYALLMSIYQYVNVGSFGQNPLVSGNLNPEYF